MSTIYKPTIELIERESNKLIKELSELDKGIKKNEITKEFYKDESERIRPILSSYLTAITTLKINEANEDESIINTIY